MKNKLNNLKQIDGKLHAEDSFEPVTIAQVLGDTGLSKYNTLNEDEYRAQLSQMNLAELRGHATTVGIIPRDVSTERLVKQLVGEFNKYVSVYKRPQVKNKVVKPTKEVLAIMAQVK